MTEPLRVVTRENPHEWLCRPDIVDAETLLLVGVLMPSGPSGTRSPRRPNDLSIPA